MEDVINSVSTTLVTFLYQNLQARSVDLLGSWDNFTKAYPMRLDARRGGDQWTGCYTFDDIAFDGDDFVAGGVRSGGLKMGGTYWYYYSVDGGMVETYNEAEPHSTQCPLLPGQCVNVLEVPFEGTSASRRESISSTTATRTLDPQDRYVNPRPAPNPRPSLPRLNTSASDDNSTFRLKPRLNKWWQYPATAVGDSSDYARLASNCARPIRAVAAPSTSTVKSALAFLKGLDVAISPVEASRGRSRTWPTRDRPSSPSPIAEKGYAPVRGETSSPTTSTPTSIAPRLPARDFHARTRTATDEPIHKRHVSESPVPSPRLAAAPFHTRSVSVDHAEERTFHSHLPHHMDSRHHVPPRSTSRSHGLAPLRTCSPSQVADCSDLRMAVDEILDEETQRLLMSSKSDPVRWQSKSGSTGDSASGPTLDKELPPLPTYLIPDPLNIISKSKNTPVDELSPASADQEHSRAFQSRFSDWSTVNQSRFSEWTAYSLANEEALEFDADDSDGQMSPTFSSVHGESLDAMTPRHLSVHASPLMDKETQPFLSSHDDVGPHSDNRPDLAALQQLRDMISSSSLPSHNTFRPTSSSPYLPKIRERVLDLDAAPGIGEVTPTKSAFKLHETLDPLVAGDSSLMAELMNEFDYLGEVLS